MEALWAKPLIKVGVYLLIAIGVGLIIWKLFFADIQRRVTEEHAKGVIATEQVQGAKETGIEAANTTVRTYEHYTEIDRTVKEAQDGVNKADKGQQMDPVIDSAGAAGLCRVHHSLCRSDEQ